MAYLPNIPGANDLLSQSQAEIQQNFTELKTFVDVNHITFGDPNAGKHKFLQMPNNAAPTTAIGIVGLYASNGVTSGQSELYFKRQDNATAYAFTEGTNGTTGWSRLPSGVIMKWFTGNTSNVGTRIVAVDLNSIGPNYTTLYNVQASVSGASGDTNGLYIQSVSISQVELYRANNAPVRIYYVTTLGI